MALNLTDFRRGIAEADLDLGDGVIVHVEYHLDWQTPEVLIKLEEFRRVNTPPRGQMARRRRASELASTAEVSVVKWMADFLADTIVDWDIEDDGEPYEITPANILKLPSDLMGRLFRALVTNPQPGNANGSNSADGSLTQGEGSTQV